MDGKIARPTPRTDQRVHARACGRADGGFYPCADAADDLAEFFRSGRRRPVRDGDLSPASQNCNDIFARNSVGRDFKAALVNTRSTRCRRSSILPLSVMLGLLVHQSRAAAAVFLRTVLFSTYMVPMIAVAMVWSKLYSPTEGPLNQILEWAGLEPQPWLSSPGHGAALARHPQRLAAGRLLHRADGRRADADPRRRLRGRRHRRRHGLRLLWRDHPAAARRTLLFVVVIALINAVQVFEPVALITQGGPAGSTNTLTYHIRRVGIERTQGGLGSAMAVMLLLALVVTVAARVRPPPPGRRA